MTHMRPFYGWVIFHCLYVSQLLYPFICRCTSRLLPCPSYCKQCRYEHWGTRITSYCIIHNISLVVKWLCGLKNHGLVTQLLGHFSSVQFSSVQTLSRVQLFATPWIAARQASLSITNFQSSFRPTSIESVMPSSHLILCRPLLLLPPIPPSIRVFSNESTRRMRWPKYWSFSLASFLPKKFQGWSPSEWTRWISLQCKGLSRVFSNTTVQKHQFFSAQLSL